MFHFEEKNDEERSRYITEDHRHNYYPIFNKDLGIFSDKTQAYDAFKPFFMRDVLLLDTAKDKALFYDFIKKHPDFIVKPRYGARGIGVHIVHVEKGKEEAAFHKLKKEIPVFLEEIIVQNEEMARLHPESINTCRITTVLVNSECRVINPFIRMGRGKSVVDNRSAGGVLAPVDPVTGKITDNAIDKYGQQYIKHPDTGIVLRDFSIPEWEGALALVDKLCRVIPGYRFIGWDLALTDKGWVMVEGNSKAAFTMIQYFAGLKEEMDRLCKLVQEEESLSGPQNSEYA